MIVDTRGKDCPTPVIMTKKVFDAVEDGVATIISDKEISKNNILKYLENQGISFEVKEENGEYYITAAKGYTCQVANESKVNKHNEYHKNTVLLISSDEIGSGEPALGKKLMNGFIGNLKNIENNKPSIIILLNTAVYLTTINSETVNSLKELEDVEILSCGTCLSHLKLENDLNVGEVTDAHTVMTKIFNADKVVRL